MKSILIHHNRNMTTATMLFLLLLSQFFTICIGLPNSIHGIFEVNFNENYSNKSGLSWGTNDDATMSVLVSLSESASLYNCSNKENYSCDDTLGWMYDWNKLWGKSRCGDYTTYHQNSDRFTFRRCSDSSCDAYIENQNRIQIGAYSYDDGNKPYDGKHPDLMKTFQNTILPNTKYNLTLNMNINGTSTFILSDKDGSHIETQYITHNKTCEKNFSKGLLTALYFGGSCRAPENIIVEYVSE